DGMIVPALANRPSGELGHPNYQHPERLRNGAANGESDRFAHLVIYTALRVLVHGGRERWERHDNGDNLLFRQQDFEQPSASKLFQELLQAKDPAIRALAGHLLLASQALLERVPLLQELVPEGVVPLLNAGDHERIQALMTNGPDAAMSKETASA